MKVNSEIKQLNRIRTLQYILNHRSVSRHEIAADLGFSMPTVLQNVTELIEAGFICESGKYGSTGGRKATVLSIQEGKHCVVGVEVSKQHLCLVMADMSRRILDMVQHELPFQNTLEYYVKLGYLVQRFIDKNKVGAGGAYTLMGVGFSLPGILDLNQGMLVKSHTLEVSNVSLLQFSRSIPYDTCFDNDANAAAYAEVEDEQQNTIYLSLSDTVGGAMYLNGNLYRGDNYKGAESVGLWETYLNNLALAVSNLRMAYDCKIILGGDVGGNMPGYTYKFEEKLREYNNFDYDTSYIQLGKYQSGSAAIGAAQLMSKQYIAKLRF